MKILLVHNFYQQAGGEDSVFEAEGQLLEERGHEVLRFTAHNDAIQDMSRLQAARATLWNGEMYSKIAEVAAGFRPDVAHFHNTFPLISPAGYYAAREQVMVVGRKRAIEKVRVLGPTRPYSQVELSQTDALILGLRLPVATDGADPACQPITLVGPEGAVTLTGGGTGGAFIARRHIHISDKTAAQLGVTHGDLLDLRLDGPRPTTLHGILVRVKAGWRTEVHLDTDEGNAVGIRSGQMGTLIIPRQ